MITLLSPYPAALLKTGELRTVVVADLHIGWEVAVLQEGIHVPSQTPKLLKKLIEVVSTYKADRLIVLGDVKHTVATAVTPEWRDVPEFFGALERRVNEVLVVRGNHDGNIDALLTENIKVLPSTGLVIGDVGFFHGHRWPSPTLLSCRTLVMGHVHPVVALRDPAGFRTTKQVWVQADCDGVLLSHILLRKHRGSARTIGARAKCSRLLIMPSFNDLLGGRALNEERGSLGSGRIAGPVLRSKAVDLSNAETYLIDGTCLGSLKQLRTLG